MGSIKKQAAVKYFCAVTFTENVILQDIFCSLKNLFPSADTQSDIFDFDSFTDYYQLQMGTNLKKCFISSEKLVEIERLPAYKIESNRIETEFFKDNQRQVNLDPGYITEAKLVLATTKDYSHRLYLTDGIFGDLHMVFTNKSYQPQPWTYPDYKQKLAVNYFNKLRSIYKEQLVLSKNLSAVT
jgi:hypothetical protein